MNDIIALEGIDSKNWTIRGLRVMIDFDIAALYEVATGHLNRAVKRNITRFPPDFMFQLTKEEAIELSRCQIGILKPGQNIKYLPYVFTEQGIAMLSGVLTSERAVVVNIQIMRAFVRIRNLVADNTDVRKAIANIEKRLNVHDRQIQIAFDALKGLLQPKREHVEIPAKEYSPDGGKKMGFTKTKRESL